VPVITSNLKLNWMCDYFIAKITKSELGRLMRLMYCYLVAFKSIQKLTAELKREIGFKAVTHVLIRWTRKIDFLRANILKYDLP
jgi:hypothetical protein